MHEQRGGGGREESGRERQHEEEGAEEGRVWCLVGNKETGVRRQYIETEEEREGIVIVIIMVFGGSSNPLGKIGKAMEGKYFKDEQEYAIMRRRDWLRDQGQGVLDKYAKDAATARREAMPRINSNVLTEILGQSVRFAPKVQHDKLRLIDDKIYQKEHGRGAARRQSLMPKMEGLGTQISLGRAKYDRFSFRSHHCLVYIHMPLKNKD